jgi:hypothetical protein
MDDDPEFRITDEVYDGDELVGYIMSMSVADAYDVRPLKAGEEIIDGAIVDTGRNDWKGRHRRPGGRGRVALLRLTVDPHGRRTTTHRHRRGTENREAHRAVDPATRGEVPGPKRNTGHLAPSSQRASRGNASLRRSCPRRDVFRAASPRAPAAEAVEKLGWNDMQMIFATHFASEIAAVTDGAGEAPLRERVTSLDEDQRQLLREALDEVKIAS